VGAAIYVFINIAGAGYALAMDEVVHAGVHFALLAVGVAAYGAWRLGRRTQTQTLQPGDQRLEYLQQSVDAMALEVERIGEAQRFNEKLRKEQQEISPPKKEE
jgi:hypothetical protein